MAKEIDMKELRNLVMEEVEKVEKDLKKVKAKEVTPDEYADTLEKPVDWESKLGIKPTTKGGKAMLEAIRQEEKKAVRLVKALRSKRSALVEEMQKDAVAAENKRLREAIAKVKSEK